MDLSSSSEEDLFAAKTAFTDNPPLSPYGDSAEERYISSFSSYRTVESSVVTSNSVSNSAINGPTEPQEIDPIQGGRVGLGNLGNTCFLNSTLQCLLAADELSIKLAQDMKDGLLSREKFFTTALASLFLQMWRKPPKSSSVASAVDPRALKVALGRVDHRFVGYHQEDSQEALAIILDRLHEDLKKSATFEGTNDPDGWLRYSAKEDSFIRELFHGQLRSNLTCAACGHCSQTFDPFCFLNLPFPRLKPAEPAKPVKKTSFTIACFNDTITSPHNAYFKIFRDFSSPSEFNSYFSGAGVCIVKMDARGSKLKEVLTRTPASDDLQTSKTKNMIAYRLDYSSTSFLVTLKYELGSGYPILVSLPYGQEFTLENFIKEFFDNKLKQIVKQRYTSELGTFNEIVNAFHSQPDLHFDLQEIERINPFLYNVVIEARDTKEVSTLFGSIEEFFDTVSDTTKLDDKDDEEEDELLNNLYVNRNKATYPPRVTLAECIETFMAQESVTAVCEKCKTDGPASKKLDLWRLPPILILHLKRFSFASAGSSIYYSYGGSAGSKISSQVDFPVTESLKLKNLHDETFKDYELFAVSQHYGSLNFGHYTAVTWHRGQKCWSLADDGNITRYAGPDDWLSGAQESAYVLFYRQRQ